MFRVLRKFRPKRSRRSDVTDQPRAEHSAEPAVDTAAPPVSVPARSDVDSAPVAPPSRRDRATITIQPPASLASPGPATATASVAHPRGISAPLVLAGSPRLGSDPGRIPAGPDIVADSLVDGGQWSGGVIRAGSIRGDEHRYFGTTRQDAMGFWTFADPRGRDGRGDPGGVLLACVADGLGSKPRSQLGSQLACQATRDAVPGLLPAILSHDGTGDDPAGQSIVDAVCARLRQHAGGLAVPADDLATTLVAALVWRVDAGRHRARLVQVGDSTAFVHGGDGWRPCYVADEGGVYSTATFALPNHVGAINVTTIDLIAGDLLVLCSDGLANPMRSPGVREQLAEWWGRGHIPSLPEFYWQLSFRAQSYGDDRTAVCLWIQ
jgi:serine/threonine protein phosphatase PrpC